MLQLHYKAQWVTGVCKIIFVHPEEYRKHKFYKQDADVVNNKTGCTRNNHCALRVNINFNNISQLRPFLRKWYLYLTYFQLILLDFS